MSPARLPDFLIIGAAKAGTTSLAAWLGAHPDVFIPARKELHFFDRPGWDDPVRRAAYENEFAGRREKVVGEATPSYLGQPGVAERMAELVPDARLVAVLRNPVDRAVSHYWYAHSLGRDPRTIEDALFAPTDVPGLRYLDAGRYVDHLERLTRHYPRGAVLVRLFEDLIDHPDVLYRDACSFLGVEATAHPAAVGQAFNPHYRLRAPWVRNWMMRVHAYRRWPRLAQRVERSLMVPTEYPKPDPALRARLAPHFAEANARLADWLGRDLAW